MANWRYLVALRNKIQKQESSILIEKKPDVTLPSLPSSQNKTVCWKEQPSPFAPSAGCNIAVVKKLATSLNWSDNN